MVAPERQHTGDGEDPRALGSLRHAWRIAMGAFLSLVVALVVLAIVLAQYQHRLFSDTTADLERRMAAVVALEATLRAVDVPAAALMYQLGGPEAYPQHQRDYDAISARIDAAFTDVAEVVADHHGEPEALGRARASWEEMDAGVRSAPARVADGSVQAALAAGEDPFAAAWEALSAVGAGLSDLRGLMVADLRGHMDGADRIQGLIVPAGAVVLAMALTAAGLTGRSLHRRVLGPILALRSAAEDLRHLDVSTTVDALGPNTVREVAELALVLQDTAGSLRASHQRLRDQAHTDALTGLANRASFAAALDAVFACDDGGTVAVLFLDLDDFKVVNDTLGHAAGDELLAIAARRLESATRETTITARLGGDEFAVVLRDVDEATAVAVAQRILTALEAPVRLAGRSVTIACSIGVAVQPADGSVADADELLQHADQAMYTAKKHGKHRLEVFSAELYAGLQAGTELRSQLTGALARGQFRLHYQPILDLEDGRVLGLEALIRWQHPTRGVLPPAEFIALAEESGDIVAMGAWVIDEACRQLKAWHDEGTYDASVWMSVNVSARQLETDGLLPTTLTALSRHALPPAALVLEITEAVAITNTPHAVAVLRELRAEGVTIALDDFGMGFSSLGYLAELPVDVLKIDRAFVSSGEPKTNAALQAIVTLGQRLGLRLIAEGIETSADLDTLRQLGPLAGQGYLFGRPVPDPTPSPLHAAYGLPALASSPTP